MDLLNKIDSNLVKKRLNTIKEAGRRSRLRPAVIIMKRGTIIEADHVRQVNHPETGTPLLVFGIKPGIYPKWSGRYQRIGAQKASIIGRLRDFTTAGEYVPASHQDDTGWDEPDEDGMYDAHRDFTWNQRFQHIMTCYVENVQEVRWGHESENKMRDEPDRHDYRGKDGRQWATKSLLDIFQMIGDNQAPVAILQRIVNGLITGVNQTIAARSQYMGIDQAVKLVSLEPADPAISAVRANWISGENKGSSLLPPEMSASELTGFLEEESADYWNSP